MMAQKAGKNSVLLSICIPTYNRAKFLKEAIESVLAQVERNNFLEIELFISDNASTDDTEGLVAQYIKQHPALVKYRRNDRNLGSDANILLLIEHAAGRYIWILGDDDLIVNGAIGKVIEEIKSHENIDIYFSEKEDFRLTVDRPMRFRRIMRLDRPETYDFKQPGVMDRYFKNNTRLIAYCNFISNLIINREKLMMMNDRQLFAGSGYNHIYLFQNLLWGRQRGILRYIPDPLVARRWGTDAPDGPEKRLKMEVEVFRKIVAEIFSEKKYMRRFDDLLLLNDGFSWAVRLKINMPWRFYSSAFPLLFREFWSVPRFWLKIVPLVFLPSWLLRLVRGLYRKTVKGEDLSLGEMLER